MYIVKFSKRAEKDMKLVKQSGYESKVKELLNIIMADPFHTPPAYERLVWDLRGGFSRRINLKHRLVYEILDNSENIFSPDGTPYEGIVRIIQMWTHYE